MNTVKANEILAWARNTSEMFGVSIERALETVAAWEQSAEEQKDTGFLRRTMVKLARPDAGFATHDGTITVNERRRAVLQAMQMRAGTRFDVAGVASLLFRMEDITPDERSSLMKAIRQDLAHLEKMAVVSHSNGTYWADGLHGMGNGRDDLYSHSPL